MRLFHGSNVEVAVPDLAKSKPYKDFGQGFQLRRYQSGAISIEELVRELQYARGITFQYFFGTPLALSKLTKL